jgi:cell division protein FtsB
MTTRRQQHDSEKGKKTLYFLGALFLVLLLLWVLFAPKSGLVPYLKLRQEIAVLTEENNVLEARKKELVEDIKRLRSDDKYLEDVARKKHGLLKKNETVFEFEPPKTKKE